MQGRLLDDQELIARCLSQDPRAWDEFCGRFSKLIHWAIRKTLERTEFASHEDLIEEIFQDFFRDFLDKEKLQVLREAVSVRKFITVAACHKAHDRLKSRRRREHRYLSVERLMAQEAQEDGRPDPHLAQSTTFDQAHRRETEDLVERILGELSPKERACVEFSYLDGKAHREISLLLGMPQNTVSTILRRSKEKIQRSLAEKGITGPEERK